MEHNNLLCLASVTTHPPQPLARRFEPLLPTGAPARGAVDAERPETATPSQSLRVGLCVTGQIGRLELRSKVQQLARPTIGGGSALDLVFVLSPHNQTVFVNERPGFRDHYEHNAKAVELAASSFVTEEDIVAAVNQLLPSNRSNRRLSLAERLDGDFFFSTAPATGAAAAAAATAGGFDRRLLRVFVRLRVQAAGPPLLGWYVRQLDKPDMSAKQREVRARSHLAQWTAESQCLDEFERLEAGGGWRYDLLVKLRDDSFVLKPLNVARLPWKGFALVKDCLGWTGTNDKIAAVDRDLAPLFFRTPLASYENASLPWEQLQSATNITIKNPETYLKAVFSWAGLPLRELPPRLLPIVASRLKTGEASGDVLKLWARSTPQASGTRSR